MHIRIQITRDSLNFFHITINIELFGSDFRSTGFSRRRISKRVKVCLQVYTEYYFHHSKLKNRGGDLKMDLEEKQSFSFIVFSRQISARNICIGKNKRTIPSQNLNQPD